MILQVSHIKKGFPGKEVLKDVTFHMEENEKVAIVGNNGAGKTTLFNILTDTLKEDEGEYVLKKNATLGYLKQITDFTSDATIYEEVLSVFRDLLESEKEMRRLENEMASASEEELSEIYKKHEEAKELFEKHNGYAIQSEITGVLKGVGFSEAEFQKPIASLSGGEKTRVSLARLLLKKPDLLLLDEPTNHLDLNGTVWLENYLRLYKGAVLVISHDRYFINRFVTKIIHIEWGIADSYEGNYDLFIEKYNQRMLEKRKAYEKQEAEIRHQEEVIRKLRSFSEEKFYKRAESREKVLAKMERIEKPKSDEDVFHLRFPETIRTGNDVLTIKELGKEFPEKTLFNDFNATVKRGEKIAIIGDNGTGKTTLFKIIKGDLSSDTGTYRWGTNVILGYYDQEHADFSSEKTLFEEISDSYPTMTNEEIRSHLSRFLFTDEDVFKKVSSLSGGEKGRLSLAKLVLTKANVLLLDEPTNHLDITGKEILENALINYEGTILTVSHDRYFIEKTAGKMWELRDKKINVYDGDYNYYLEKAVANTNNKAEEKTEMTKSQSFREEQKKKEAFIRKREREMKELEERISEMENELAEIEEKFSDPEIASDAEKLGELSIKREEINEKLEKDYIKWNELAEGM